MAKKTAEEPKKKLSFEEQAAALEKKYASPNHDVIIIPTGSIGYDDALGGGYHTGRIYEKIAWEGAGKTTMALHAIAEAQKLGLNVAYIDSEHALDKAYAESIGVDWEKLKPTLFQPSNGEDAFDIARALLLTGEMRLCIFDSISGMKPKKELEDPAGTSNLGLHARLVGTEVPKIASLSNKFNCCCIFVSQFREKIGVMFGSPETTQGGNAMRFWASVRTEFRKELSKDGDEVYGIVSKFKTIKNKVVSPYKTGRIPIVFGKGIDTIAEIIELGDETGVLSKYGQSIIVLIHPDNPKMDKNDFCQLLIDNPDYKEEIIANIKERLKNPVEEVSIEEPVIEVKKKKKVA